MLRTPTLRDLLRCVQRHLPLNRVPWYITGAISLSDIPPAEDEGGDGPDDMDGAGDSPGTVVLKDDDDIEAWWCISYLQPMEVQVVLDSGSTADGIGEMASILGVQDAGVDVGLKRPRVDTGIWEEIVGEERNARRRLG